MKMKKRQMAASLAASSAGAWRHLASARNAVENGGVKAESGISSGSMKARGAASSGGIGMAYGMAAWQMALIEAEKWRKAAWQSWRERQYQRAGARRIRLGGGVAARNELALGGGSASGSASVIDAKINGIETPRSGGGSKHRGWYGNNENAAKACGGIDNNAARRSGGGKRHQRRGSKHQRHRRKLISA
jgi:hypothetical protein